MRHDFTPVKMPIIKILQTINSREEVGKWEPSCTVDRNVNRYSHYGEQYGNYLKKKKKKLGIKLPHDPIIPLLDIYHKDNHN